MVTVCCSNAHFKRKGRNIDCSVAALVYNNDYGFALGSSEGTEAAFVLIVPPYIPFIVIEG